MRIVKWVALGAAALFLLALVVIYGGSTLVLRKAYAVVAPQIVADTTPAGLAEGARVAAAIGCRGCHGPEGRGELIAEVPGVAHIVAPALAPIVAAYSDPELARLIRHGIKRDGTATYFMPVDGHNGLADEDLARIIAWLRTLKPSDKDRKDGLHFGPMGRVALIAGAIGPEVLETTRAQAKRPADMGAYISDTVCAGCHSMKVERPAHDDGRRVPPLLEAVPPYELPAFRKLLKTGVGMTPRDLGLMARVSKGDLSYLTEAEVEAVHAYLRAEAGKP